MSSGLGDDLSPLPMHGRELVLCSLVNTAAQSSWADVRVGETSRIPDPLACEVKWTIREAHACGMSSTSWKRQQSNGKQQDITLEAAQRPGILDTSAQFALCGGKLSVGSRR